MFEKIELRKTRDFSLKINVTFEFIRQNFKMLAKCIFYISGGPILVGGLVLSFQNQQTLSNFNGRGIFGSTYSPEMLPWLFLAYVVMACASVMTVLSVNEFVKLYGERPDPSTIEVTDVWNGVKKNFGQMLGAGFLALLMIVIALVFLFFPGVYVAVVLSLLAPVIVFEQKSIGEAFTRCFNLITDKWWSTAGLIFITSLIVYFMSLVFSAPQIIFSWLFAMHTLEGGFSDPPVWQQAGLAVGTIISYLGSTLMGTIVQIAIIFQYFNLVERKEATGLLSKLESFGKTEEPTAPASDETY